jgi:hypothetical protein
MKKTIIALSTAVLIAAAPAVFAKDVTSKTPSAQHKVSRKHHPGVTNYALRREMRAKGSTTGYPSAFGYAPGAPRAERWLAPDQAPGGAGATPGPGGGNTSVTTGQQAFGANGNPNLPVPNLTRTGPAPGGGCRAGGGGGGGGWRRQRSLSRLARAEARLRPAGYDAAAFATVGLPSRSPV